jgi:hypothetical protein
MSEDVAVYGVNKTTGILEYLGQAPISPSMKRRDIAVEYFGHFKDDDGSDADMMCCALEIYHEWLISQGWKKSNE